MTLVLSGIIGTDANVDGEKVSMNMECNVWIQMNGEVYKSKRLNESSI